MRRSIAIVAVLAGTTLVAGASSADAVSGRTSPASCEPWHLTRVPDRDEMVAGLGGLSSSDLWAVMDASYAPHRPNIEHWDGASWSPSPIDARDGDLQSVVEVAPDDAWAVGTLSEYQQTLALHWDGSIWSPVSVPSPFGSYDILYDVSATSSSDVWAVGVTGYRHGLIVHWDGSQWSIVDHPNLPGGQDYQAVLAIAPDDVWAAGSRIRPDFTAFMQHWDGTRWSNILLPERGHAFLNDLGASGPDDVWAVGEGDGSVIYHWDGVAWTRVSRRPYPLTGRLRSVAVLGPDDAWVAGLIGGGGPPVMAHWNGHRWTAFKIPDTNGWMNAIEAFSATDVWVGGYSTSTAAIAARYVACAGT